MRRRRAKGRLPVLDPVQKVARQLEQAMGVRAGDAVVVGLDEPIPFRCARSGNCCTGRHLVANITSPIEVRLIYEGLRERGRVRYVHDLVRNGFFARVITPPPAAQRTYERQGLETGAGIDANDFAFNPDATFLGLAFRMVPDAGMQDGDRCVFLQGTRSFGLSCMWHGERAQPAACALAPLAVEPTLSQGPDPKFFYPGSRTKWCEGMRLAKKGELPGTTAREILDRYYGWDRLEEARRFFHAQEARKDWTPSEESPHSPLARHYIDELPELHSYLAGF